MRLVGWWGEEVADAPASGAPGAATAFHSLQLVSVVIGPFSSLQESEVPPTQRTQGSVARYDVWARPSVMLSRESVSPEVMMTVTCWSAASWNAADTAVR